MFRKNCCLVFFLLQVIFVLQGQVSLEVHRPDDWNSEQATIEAAQFSIQPRGVYMEVGMYLTLSAKGTTLELDSAALEVLLRFTLPSGSMIIDSWLWINEDIIQAAIEQRWEAIRTYESIVGVRLDPSLLTKEEQENTYQLRVFPLQADSSRRVKITYLVPSNWSNGQVSIPLPTDILNASLHPINNVPIQCFLNNEFTRPRIAQLPNRYFQVGSHPVLGDHFWVNLSNKEIAEGVAFELDVPMQDGVFVSDYQEGERTYYQLVVLPDEVLLPTVTPPNKVAVLIDYDSTTTTISKEMVLSTLEEQLIQNLEPTDSFNLFFSQPMIEPFNPNWFPADASTIRTVFNLIEETEPLADYSQLSELLTTGIDFVNNQGNDGSIVLLSCAELHLEKPVADRLLESLTPLLEQSNVPIYIADYQNKNQHRLYCWEEGVEYFGNEYLYTNLIRTAGGSLQTFRENDNLLTILHKNLQAISLLQSTPTVNLALTGGSCFNEYRLPQPAFAANNTPIVQVGKCRGQLPYTVDIAGKVAGENKTIQITTSSVNEGTDLHKRSWGGNYIQELEKNKPWEGLTNSILKEIIKWSIEYRVLSLYTAFLALEVELGGFVCTQCIDETSATVGMSIQPEKTDNTSANEINIADLAWNAIHRDGTESSLPEGDSIITATNSLAIDTFVQLTATPNPFNISTTIHVQLTSQIDREDLAFSIYDLNGSVIQTFPTPILSNSSTINFNWDGRNTQGHTMPSGMYIFSIATPIGQKHLKIIRL